VCVAFVDIKPPAWSVCIKPALVSCIHDHTRLLFLSSAFDCMYTSWRKSTAFQGGLWRFMLFLPNEDSTCVLCSSLTAPHVISMSINPIILQTTQDHLITTLTVLKPPPTFLYCLKTMRGRALKYLLYYVFNDFTAP